LSELTVAGATSENGADREDPFKEAVTTAV
jgi:hypothetical protein